MGKLNTRMLRTACLVVPFTLMTAQPLVAADNGFRFDETATAVSTITAAVPCRASTMAGSIGMRAVASAVTFVAPPSTT